MTTEAELYNALKYRVEVDEYGNRRYYNSAGYLHRDEGPAVITRSGTKMWFQNGWLHRIGKPAVVYPNGNGYWYLHGEEYTKSEYDAKLKDLGI